MESSVPLSTQLLDRLWTVFDTDATIRACRSAIEARLLGEGVAYVDRMYKSVVDVEFNALVQREYVRFARDVLDNVLVQGFACFFIDKRGHYPYVCPRNAGMYVIGVDKHRKRTLSFVQNGGTEPDRSAFFIIDEWPDTDGGVRSAVAACQRVSGFRMMVELNTSIADYARARPVVYTETTSQHMAGGANLVFPDMRSARMQAEAQAFSMDGASLAADVHRARAMIDDASTTMQDRMLSRASDHQQMLARSLNLGVLDGRDVRIDPLTGLPVFDAENRGAKEFAKRVIPLPIDAKASNAPRPESRGDLVNVLKFCSEQICIVVGVSPASIGVDVGRLKSDYQQSEAMTWTTVMRFKRILASALTDVYVGLFGPKDDLMVTFPSLMQSYMLRELYKDGLVRREAYIASVSDRFSIPVHFFRIEAAASEAPAPRPRSGSGSRRRAHPDDEDDEDADDHGAGDAGGAGARAPEADRRDSKKRTFRQAEDGGTRADGDARNFA